MSSWTSPDTIKSIALGRPSCTLATRSAGTPRARRYCSVPSVATMRNPSSWKRRTIGTTVGLSESFTVTKIAPASGRLPSAAICALANPILDGVLDVDQPDDPERFRERLGVAAHLRDLAVADQIRGHDARRVPRVHAGVLDVLHHPRDDRPAAVGDRVHVALEGVLEEAVDQDRMLGRDAGGFLEVIAQGAVVVHNLHGPPTCSNRDRKSTRLNSSH